MSKPTHAFHGFDESTYLSLNPDVAVAVRNGGFPSGWAHYLFYGSRENRPGVPPGADQAIGSLHNLNSAEPAPPEHLRKRVHGAEDLEGFERIGKIVAFNISSATHSELPSDAPCRILDFGCGCGRVIRYFSKLTDNAEFHGSDIDPEAIGWCQQNLAHLGQFVVNPTSPPLPFEDNFFDFIFSISVFTHLPEDMEHAWLAELRRVTKPGGLLLLTSHGDHLLTPYVPEETLRQFLQSGFYYLVGAETEGLPSFYHTSFHTDDYIKNRWSRYFAIEKFIKKGIADNQDLILCRK